MSIDVYSYIINHSNTANRQVITFLLNKTEEGREFLKTVLSCQMESEIEHAYSEITRMPIINMQTGQIGDREQYRMNKVSIATEDLIDDSVSYFGINLTCMVPFNPYLFEIVRKYEGV